MLKEMIIADDSCNGEEEAFKNWMNENYPEIETVIKNTMHGGYYENRELVQDNFWTEYCSQ